MIEGLSGVFTSLYEQQGQQLTIVKGGVSEAARCVVVPVDVMNQVGISVEYDENTLTMLIESTYYPDSVVYGGKTHVFVNGVAFTPKLRLCTFVDTDVRASV